MRLKAHFRDEHGNLWVEALAAQTVEEAVKEAKTRAEKRNRGNLALNLGGAYTFEPLEIIDYDRNGYSVWQNERRCGVRGWKR